MEINKGKNKEIIAAMIKLSSCNERDDNIEHIEET